MTQTKRNFLVLAALLAFSTSAMSADMIGNCELSGAKGSIPIATPAKPGQLTVQVSLPAPIWWNGDTPEAIKDGMEYCMAAEIRLARRLRQAGSGQRRLGSTGCRPNLGI